MHTFTGSMLVVFSESLGTKFVTEIAHLIFYGIPIVVIVSIVSRSVTYMHMTSGSSWN